MRKLFAFNFITLDGYYKGPKEDISWHRHGAEENAYAAEGLKSGSTLLFGRVTYEMIASYWPYLAKVIGIFFSMDKMIGKDFETGLADLKAIAEK